MPVDMLAEEPATLALLQVFALVLFGGGLGGTLDIWHKIDLVGGKFVYITEPLTLCRLFALLAIASIIGTGGSIAVLFGLAWSNKLDISRDIKSQVFLFTASFVAGFIGRRLLVSIATRLEEQITETRHEVQTSRKESALAVHMGEYNAAIVESTEAMGPSGTPVVQRVAADKLLQLKDRMPTDRKVNILLGRLLKRLGDLDGSIANLTSFLEAKKRRGEDKDNDYADVLYNRACYYALKGDKESAYRDLEQSTTLAPRNKEDARSDPDFKAFWNEDRFKELVHR
jgi:tetratricopeptide (TPR) repeat protein